MSLIKYSDKEKKIIWWAMLFMMIAYLSYSLFILSSVGAIEYCVGEELNGKINVTCFKTRFEASNYANSTAYPINLDHNYLNNYSNINLWDK